ncbi:hypothetical protein HWB57_gp047 [Erwinia phage vB_EamM-Bue1]|uniref:Uncharacterized protein n=2 Tax=Nezavisimistyvirus TaxID=2841279 RepID=A0A0A0YXD1_9CAUD|nr:hypothetical protein NW77_040 [Erwinia phage phiEa2809]YP_009837646.1 hypothetical protein HWB57_gp047 [Erwinia phage vB_EamM-Bue1]AIX13048.1 hypothetical protein NW77_040 [Erwinia phage phiEa2809]AVO22887.1 hypothetical protein [Erwinia phage vB_EamM-Bue1]
MIYPWLPARIPDELKDVPFVHPKNPRGLTPREIWIHLGNENGLRFVQPDIFLDLFIRNCLREIEENPQCLYIISDVRTKPEYDWIKANQIKLTRISKANREGIVEDDVEAYVDQMEVDHEFINPFNGKNAFIEFYRSTL